MGSEQGITLSTLISIGTFFLCLIGAIIGYFKFVVGIIERIKAIEIFEKDCNIRTLNIAFAKMEARMELMWEPVIKAAVAQIKKPTHFEMDELLDKISQSPKSMTKDELEGLRTLLEEDENGKPKEDLLKYALIRGLIASLLSDKEVNKL